MSRRAIMRVRKILDRNHDEWAELRAEQELLRNWRMFQFVHRKK
jgi:hypothetical protein